MPGSFFTCRRSTRRREWGAFAGWACALLVSAAIGVRARAGAWGQNPAPNTQPSTPSTQRLTPDTQRPSPDVRVEYFGSARGYVVGTDDVDVLCVVRNDGSSPLPDRSLRVRCY